MLLSTLQSYVEAMGGQLAIVAELPNRLPVRIKRFGMLAGETEDLDHRPSRPRDDAADQKPEGVERTIPSDALMRPWRRQGVLHAALSLRRTS